MKNKQAIQLLHECNTSLVNQINKAREAAKEFTVMHTVYWPSTFMVFDPRVEGKISNDWLGCEKFGPRDAAAICKNYTNDLGEHPIHFISTTFYAKFINWAEWQIDNNNETIISLGGEPTVIEIAKPVERPKSVTMVKNVTIKTSAPTGTFESLVEKLNALERRINFDYARCRNVEFFWETKHGMKYAERWDALTETIRNDHAEQWEKHCNTKGLNPNYDKGDVCA